MPTLSSLFVRPLIGPVLALLALAFVTSAAAQDSTPPPNPPSDVDPEMVRDAGDKAVTELLKDLLARTDLPKRFAILPMQHDLDGDYFTLQLRNQFADQGQANGYELYTRMDDDWKNLLNEIKWGQQYGDTMDPATVQKFGRIQGVQGIITGRLVSVSRDDKGTVHVRITAQAFEVETGRFLWGQEKIGEADAPAPAAPPMDWIKIGAFALGGVAVIIIVVGLLRAMGQASRPR
jgi:hypothetical protein